MEYMKITEIKTANMSILVINRNELNKFRSVTQRKIMEKKMTTIKALEKSMKMSEIRTKAKNLGIIPGKLQKAELIHTIQIAEGHTPCFGRSNGQCSYTDCCFMGDCLKVRL